MLIIISGAEELVYEDNNIAETLLTNFFPSLPPYPSLSHIISVNQLLIISLTDKEIQKAIISASPHKAPGRDRLPAVVWQYI